MNSKVPFSILRLCKLTANHSVHQRWYCPALKPEIQAAVNCFDIMTKNEPGTVSQSGFVKNRRQTISSISINNILTEVYKNEFSIPRFIKALRELKLEPHLSDEVALLKSDSKFMELCELFVANSHKCSPFLLISALRSLLALKINLESQIIKTIETTILQKIDKFDGNDMVECLLLHCRMDDTDIQKNIVEVLLSEIPQKLHDLTSGSAVFKLNKVYHRFDRKSKTKLDFKLVELIKDFSPHYLCKLLCLLAGNQTRNKTLLNAISYSLQGNENKPNLNQTVDMLYALNTLNFPDSSLLFYLTDNRTSEIFSANQPSLISSLLTACGYLRWRHKEILEACDKWISDNLHLCSSREFVSYILTTATLNYTSESSSDTLKSFLPLLREDNNLPNTVWLDVVWSLAILRCVDKEMLLGVLTKDFYEPLLDGTEFHVMKNKLKLMNLKSVLKNKHPECIFSCDLFLDCVEVPKSSEVENCKRSVIDSLGNFILPEKYMYTNQSTDMGICIDAEFIMNDKGTPLPLAEYGSKAKPNMVTEVLPPGAKRVAVLVLTHKDFTLNEPQITGITSLTVELLEKQDYVVVQVPYDEFSEKITTVKKAHYLQKKIKTAIEDSNLEEENVKM